MSGEKTEDPTPKKLRDAREKGQVPNSKEVTSSFLVLAFFGLLAVSLPGLVDRMGALVLLPREFVTLPLDEALPPLGRALLGELVAISLPFLAVAALGTMVAAFAQFGVLVAPGAAMPKLENLSPSKWFKKTFGIENLVELGKGILKIALIGLAAFVVVRGGLDALVRGPACGIECLRAALGGLMWELAVMVAIPALLIAAGDFAFTRHTFTKQNKMSKDEVKREYKEMEGDPQVKGMRKSLHQQLLAEGAVEKAAKASVLVVNPTHVACALRYDRDQAPLPLVTAIGTDIIARRMIEAAERAGVPVMRNVPLARALLEDGAVDRYIPSHLVEPVAEVLRALRDLHAKEVS